MGKFIMLLALVPYFVNVDRQDEPIKSDTLRNDALNVFMSASDYIRKEIPCVNYVRDIKDADVYILSTTS